jgi:hypothetical protein
MSLFERKFCGGSSRILRFEIHVDFEEGEWVMSLLGIRVMLLITVPNAQKVLYGGDDSHQKSLCGKLM